MGSLYHVNVIRVIYLSNWFVQLIRQRDCTFKVRSREYEILFHRHDCLFVRSSAYCIKLSSLCLLHPSSKINGGADRVYLDVIQACQVVFHINLVELLWNSKDCNVWRMMGSYKSKCDVGEVEVCGIGQ